MAATNVAARQELPSDAKLVASVLGADYARLGAEVADLERAGVDRIQWDIMDGHFVPNLTFGADVVAACRADTSLGFEAHLMVSDPDMWVPGFAGSCDTIIVHAEACRHLHRTLEAIRSTGAKAGVALNPSTPLDAVRHVLDLLDLLLVMTVNPGFGGQAYIATMEPKIAAATRLFDEAGVDIPIEVDGGISARTAPRAAAAGATYLVAGSAILAHPDGKAAAVTDLRDALASHR